MVFEKGHKDLVPKESRKRAGKKMLGNNQGFKKGSTPWNKGMKMGEEHNKKMSEAHQKRLKKGFRANYKHGKARKHKNGKPLSHFVWCSQIENLPYVPKGFVIHHRDLNPHNNEIGNLVMVHNRDHTGKHRQIYKIIKEAKYA